MFKKTPAVEAVLRVMATLSEEEMEFISKEAFKYRIGRVSAAGKAGVATGTGKSSVWIKAVTGVDMRHVNGYCLEGEFVPHGKVEGHGHTGYWVICAKGYPKATILVAKRDKGKTYKFAYPSGSPGTLNDFEVLLNTTDWADVAAYLEHSGVPHATVTPTAKAS